MLEDFHSASDRLQDFFGEFAKNQFFAIREAAAGITPYGSMPVGRDSVEPTH